MIDTKAKPAVFILDDEDGVRGVLFRYLTRLGCEVRQASNVAEARESLARSPSDLSLVDFDLPDGTGADLIRWAMPRNLIKKAYCITAHTSPQNIVEVMRAGFLDVLPKPFAFEQLEALLSREARGSVGDLTRWRQRFASGLIGDDPGLLEILALVRDVADTDCTILITGESGTGKELIARAVHKASARRDGPFVALNCAAIPESLVEAELFGHARGAFTGAVTSREGRIGAADGGTLFLDEIGDMPLGVQAKLLRVLQDGCLTPVGANRSVPVNIRVVAATNKDLEVMVDAGEFRGDLFYRLNVIQVELPPLRERQGDILSLARFYLQEANRRTGRKVVGLDQSAEEILIRHPWQGNIRELSNIILRAVLLKREGILSARDLRVSAKRSGKGQSPSSLTAEGTLNLKSALDEVERQLIRQALERTGGNRTEAAALLGLNRTTLVEKLRKLSP